MNLAAREDILGRRGSHQKVSAGRRGSHQNAPAEKRGNHQKAPTLWQRMWPIALGITAVTAAVIILLLYGTKQLTPLKTAPATPVEVAMAATEASGPASGQDSVKHMQTLPARTAEVSAQQTTTAKPAATPTPSPTPQPSPVDLDYPYYIVINKGAQLVTVYTVDRDGTYSLPVRYMICSTGENNKTPDGLFRTKTKYRWQQMLASTPTYAQYATRITGSYLFHSVNYTARKPDTLKVSNFNNLGTADSGGCVRLQVADAKWIYDNVPEGTPVKIYTGPPQPEITVKLLPIQLDQSAKWDPTDPDPENPMRRNVTGATILNTPYPGVTPAPLTESFSKDVPRVTRTLPPGV